ncbi:hypothetical protein HAX54_003800, partial [Datura stramonium]|nr:hypothetical protein [Datura stramonium]
WWFLERSGKEEAQKLGSGSAAVCERKKRDEEMQQRRAAAGSPEKRRPEEKMRKGLGRNKNRLEKMAVAGGRRWWRRLVYSGEGYGSSGSPEKKMRRRGEK